jgi:hypothetical protein
MTKQTQSNLRIGKLPDLTPIKMTVQFSPDVHHQLEDYARIYFESYGEKVGPAVLVPKMVASFLASDSGFKKARRALVRD